MATPKVSFSVQLDIETHDKLMKIVNQTGKSKNQVINELIKSIKEEPNDQNN